MVAVNHLHSIIVHVTQGMGSVGSPPVEIDLQCVVWSLRLITCSEYCAVTCFLLTNKIGLIDVFQMLGYNRRIDLVGGLFGW